MMGIGANFDPLSAAATLLALGALPFAIALLTPFAKIAIVLHVLRTGLGLAQTPPALVLNAIALVIALPIVLPVLEPVLGAAQDLLGGGGSPTTAHLATLEPWLAFLDANTADAERAWAEGYAGNEFAAVAIAFVLTELREAFEIAVLVLLPFLILDIFTGTVLLSLGMHMLTPTSVSLPLKLLVFVSVNGWVLLSSALGSGYTMPEGVL